jgi:hypothetical protein
LGLADDRTRTRSELIVKERVVAYKQQRQMPTVRQSETFSGWLHDLRDAKARAKFWRASSASPTATPAMSGRWVKA